MQTIGSPRTLKLVFTSTGQPVRAWNLFNSRWKRGLSAALHLAEAGPSVALVEAEEIGHGASGRNGGQVNPGLKLGEDDLVRRFGEPGRGLFRLGEEAVDFLTALVARKGLRCSFIRPGLIRLPALPAPGAPFCHAVRATVRPFLPAPVSPRAAHSPLVKAPEYPR